MASGENIFSPNAGERLEAELKLLADIAMETDEWAALQNLFALIKGYAEHLTRGMMAAGFDEDGAQTSGWDVAWRKLRSTLDGTYYGASDVAARLEQNLAILYPDLEVNDVGEPQDPVTLTFYQTFVDCIEAPAVSKRAPWLSGD
jgi:hypothetical protein